VGLEIHPDLPPSAWEARGRAAPRRLSNLHKVDALSAPKSRDNNFLVPDNPPETLDSVGIQQERTASEHRSCAPKRPLLADLRTSAEPDEASGCQPMVATRPQSPNTGHLSRARRRVRPQGPNAGRFGAHSGAADADRLSSV